MRQPGVVEIRLPEPKRRQRLDSAERLETFIRRVGLLKVQNAELRQRRQLQKPGVGELRPAQVNLFDVRQLFKCTGPPRV